MVTRKNLRFHVGDWVVHYFHGVGRIKDIVEKGLDGNQKKYFKVSTKNMDYWIPVEDQMSDHIEPIRSKPDFEKALSIMSEPPKPIGKHHKTRKKRIHERWLNGDLNSRAKLLRDLHGRLKLEKLSFNEREMLEKVQKYFINEWLIIDPSLTRSDALNKIDQALEKGVIKLEQIEKE